MDVIPLVHPVAARRFGQYILVRKLAEGGMAEIFLAKQTGAEGFERNVVVKCMLPHFTTSKDFVAMFLDEARLAAKLHHPNIVQISDLGVADGRYYICMEYLAGEDLQSVVEKLSAKGKRIPIGLAVKIIHAATEGLEFAHGYSEGGRPMNLVHRDISPSNIFVTYQGTVKVLDFGIAKAASKAVKTEAGTVKGKWGYMSPEQARGDELDARSDLFSLGVTLHELLTGERVFKRDNELAVLIAMMNEPVPSPSTRRSDIPVELDGIVQKCLARDRNDRYRNTGELRAALEEYMSTRSSMAGGSQLGLFMLELFGQEQARQRTEVPSLSEINAGALPSADDLDPRIGTDPTNVRPSFTNLPPVGSEPPVTQRDGAGTGDRVPPYQGTGTAAMSQPLPPATAAPQVNRPPPTSRTLPLVVATAAIAVLIGGAAVFFATRPPPPVAVIETPPPVKVPTVDSPPQKLPDAVAVVKDPPPDFPPVDKVKLAPVRPIGPKEVGAVLGKSRQKITSCAERFRPELPPDRVVKVILTIKRSGSMSDVQTVSEGVSATNLGKCLKSALMAMRFPKNSNDPELKIELPLRFTGE